MSVMILGMRKFLSSMTKTCEHVREVWAFSFQCNIYKFSKTFMKCTLYFKGLECLDNCLCQSFHTQKLIVPGIWWIHAVRCWDASKMWKVINCHDLKPIHPHTHLYTHTHKHTRTHARTGEKKYSSRSCGSSGADLTKENRSLLTFIEMDGYNPVSNASVPLKSHKNVCIVPVEAK